MKKIISTNKAPQAIGTYSQGIILNDLLFTSGQIGIDPNTGNIVGGGIDKEVTQVLKNIENLLIAGGVDKSSVIKLTVFLKDLNDFSIINEKFEQFFKGHTYPARSTVEVSRLPMDALVEIECIALTS
tara:strand:- start:1338 stop:1721 length:384 start_codon:yes stop_codon:yes gene_type:complete